MHGICILILNHNLIKDDPVAVCDPITYHYVILDFLQCMYNNQTISREKTCSLQIIPCKDHKKTFQSAFTDLMHLVF